MLFYNSIEDIVAIVNSEKEIVAEYYYDGYGNCTISDDYTSVIGSINHLRYRGYYLDDETGFYYLSSRYYDSNIGRFITKDDIEYLGVSATTVSYNLYAYCLNNPVNMIDSDGNNPKWWQAILLGTAIIAVTSFIVASIAAPTTIIAITSKIALSGLKVSMLTGLSASVTRVVKSLKSSSNLSDTFKSAVLGFSDGYFYGSVYFGIGAVSSPIICNALSSVNNGYGFKKGKCMFLYKNPSVNGLTFFAVNNGKNGGRSFSIDLDISNSFHIHTNMFGSGTRKSKWISQHKWWIFPIAIGVGIGLSDNWCEW